MTIFKRTTAYLVLGIFAFLLVSAILFSLSIPDVSKFQTCFTTSMYNVNFCNKNPNYIRFAEVPKHFIDSLLISEDASFYLHNGFDLSEIKTSINENVSAGKKLRGASTITQQLIKNAFLNADRSLIRKLLEALGTMQAEKKYKKREILEFYLNMVQFGPKLFGLKNASQFYFLKDPSHLSIVESAYLVQLLPNPIQRSRDFRTGEVSDTTLDRIKKIIGKLLLYEKIKNEELTAVTTELTMSPWFDFSANEAYLDAIDRSEDLDLKTPDLPAEIQKSL